MDWRASDDYPALSHTTNTPFETRKFSDILLGRNGDAYYKVRCVITHFPHKQTMPTRCEWITDDNRSVTITHWKVFS